MVSLFCSMTFSPDVTIFLSDGMTFGEESVELDLSFELGGNEAIFKSALYSLQLSITLSLFPLTSHN